MRIFGGARLTAAHVFIAVAMVAALGGGAYAAASPSGTGRAFHGCISGSGDPGVLSVLKHGKKCKHGQIAVTWNQRGVPGPKGPIGPAGASGAACSSSDPACRGPKGDKGDACLASDPACRGPKGDPGTPATTYYARLFGVDGTVQFGKNVNSASREATGSYLVAFNHAAGDDPNGCGLSATITQINGSPPPPATAAVERWDDTSTTTTFHVVTYNSSGAAADEDFYLTAIC